MHRAGMSFLQPTYVGVVFALEYVAADEIKERIRRTAVRPLGAAWSIEALEKNTSTYTCT